MVISVGNGNMLGNINADDVRQMRNTAMAKEVTLLMQFEADGVRQMCNTVVTILVLAMQPGNDS